METIDKIFIDMDGVVADFTKAALALHSIEEDPWTKKDNLGVYSMEKLLNISTNDFWKKIDKATCSFWRNLPLTEDAESLMAIIRNSFEEDKIFFLSSPAMDPSCYKGKVEWIRKHYPKFERRLILTSHKYLLAREDRILIDDADKNINLWIAAGGKGIIVPRPWNSAYAASDKSVNIVLEQVIECLIEN